MKYSGWNDYTVCNSTVRELADAVEYGGEDYVTICPVCGKAICEGDEVCEVERFKVVIHRNCSIFKKMSVQEMLQIFGMSDEYMEHIIKKGGAA